MRRGFRNTFRPHASLEPTICSSLHIEMLRVESTSNPFQHFVMLRMEGAQNRLQ
jgi:hypothetical protein